MGWGASATRSRVLNSGFGLGRAGATNASSSTKWLKTGKQGTEPSMIAIQREEAAAAAAAAAASEQLARSGDDRAVEKMH